MSGLTVVGLAGPAQAAPPANDQIENATRITAVPQTFTGNTAAATATQSDGNCVGGRSVWYRYRPVADRPIRLTTLGSDYDTLLAVFTGSRTNRDLLRCSDDGLGLASAIRLPATAGTTYWIAVSSCCARRSREGGNYQLNVFARPRPPRAGIEVTSATTGGISGRLVLNGTASCNTASVVSLQLAARQRVGASVARGSGWVSDLPCWPGQETTWTLRVDSDTGWAFQDGTPAHVEGTAYNWDGFRQSSSEVEAIATPTNEPFGRWR